MAPAEPADHRRGAAAGTIEIVVTAIGVGLQRAMPAGEMPIWMSLLAIGREVEECRRRRATREGTIIANVSP